jgi:hypothetical protein
MNSIVAGIIAGLVGAIIVVIFGLIGTMIGLIHPVPGVSMEQWIGGELIVNGIWGAILGWLYRFFYNSIPGKGITKGIVFSLLIFLVAGVRIASLVQIYNMVDLGIATVWLGFWNRLSQGAVLGALYKK